MPDYRLAAAKAAKKYGLDPQIFLRQINAESGFRVGLTSGANAQGIAQFIPSTAAAYNVNLHDGKVADDLDGAARYMRDNLKKYGSYARALSAYNSGRPDAYKDPGFAKGETYNYVKKILNGPDIKYGGSKSTGGLSKTLGSKTTHIPGYTATASGVSGGGAIALPDTGDTGLSSLLASVNQKPAPVLTGGQIADPSFSASRYVSGGGAIQPIGLNGPGQDSGIASQLAELTAARDTSLPSVSNMASSSSQQVSVPGMQVTSPGSSTATPAKGAKATLAWARSVIGTSETNGSNHGPRIDQWEQALGTSGQPWCAIFTSLAATKGGMAKSGRTAGVAEVRAQATRGSAAYQKGFIDPARAHAGDLILFGNNHIGLVESVSSKGITMIAGNDSNKVQRRTVALGSGDIVRPKYR